MIPEKHSDLLEADLVPQVLEPITVMGPIEEARIFEEYLDDDGDEDYNDEDSDIEEIVANEEDPLDPASYGDLLMLIYHAFFQ